MFEFGITPGIDFTIGPFAVTRSLLVMWGLIVVLGVFSWWLQSRLSVDRPGPVQNALEAIVEYFQKQIREIVGQKPGPYLPLVLTLVYSSVTGS